MSTAVAERPGGVQELCLVQVQVSQGEVVKIFTDKGTMEVYFRLPSIKLSSGQRKNYHNGETAITVKLKNGKISIRAKTAELEDILKGAEVAGRLFVFILYKLSAGAQKTFSFEINEYFEFIGKQRSSKGMATLEKALQFLSCCTFDYETFVNGKTLQGSGGMGYSIERLVNPRTGKKTDRKTVELYVPWATAFIDNTDKNNQFMLIDANVFKQDLRPQQLAAKLMERYSNNRVNRKSDFETISVKHLLKTIYCPEEGVLKKKKGRYVEQLLADLETLLEENLFEYTLLFDEHNCSNDYYMDSIRFRPCNIYIRKTTNQKG